MLHGIPSKCFRKSYSAPYSAAFLLFCFLFLILFLILFCCDRSSRAQTPLHLLGMSPSEAQAATNCPKLLPRKPLIGCEGGGTLEFSLLPSEPWKRGESKTNYILKQEFRELNVYFWRGRIREAAGDKTCSSYWACSASLRNPDKFQNIHLFSKVLVDTLRGRAKTQGDFQKL